VNNFWEKAVRAAAGARVLFIADDYEGAASRAYYAMFAAARALLIAKGSKSGSAKRHASVLRAFSDQFVRHGTLDAAVGRALRLASDTRNLADYGGVVLGPERVRAVMDSMEFFMAAVEAQIAKLPREREP
jgi:uncharacterized protein (UPF0332 family)